MEEKIGPRDVMVQPWSSCRIWVRVSAIRILNEPSDRLALEKGYYSWDSSLLCLSSYNGQLALPKLIIIYLLYINCIVWAYIHSFYQAMLT